MSRIVKDISGQKFGRLTAIRKSDQKKYNKICWICECECGNEIIATQNNLSRGNTSSCGCLHLESVTSNGKKNTKEDSGVGYLYERYRRNSVPRNIPFKLTFSVFKTLTSAVCHYCGVEPHRVIYSRKAKIPYTFNGIDRVDNNSGYEESNCVPCCSICNHAKHTLSYQDFQSWIDRLVKHKMDYNQSQNNISGIV